MTDRKHLSGREFERLLEAIKGSRNEIRASCLILLMFRHGLRVSEACGSVLEQVDVESRVLHDARLKGGLSTTHPLRGEEIRAIKAWLVERARLKAPGKVLGRAFFLSEQRQAPAPLNRQPAAPQIRGEVLASPLPFIPTCCAMPAALLSPIRARTHVSFRTISGTAIFSTPCVTPPPTRHGSRSCGGRCASPQECLKSATRGRLIIERDVCHDL